MKKENRVTMSVTNDLISENVVSFNFSTEGGVILQKIPKKNENTWKFNG